MALRAGKIIVAGLLSLCLLFSMGVLIAFAEVTTRPPVLATDLDLGDYQREMEVGTSQVLFVTVIPLNTDNQTLVYYSSNSTVASVNGIGRISALAPGQATITVSCGAISRSFMLTVKAPETTTVPTTIQANDLDLGDPQRKMTVGESQMLMVTVIPTNTTNQDVTYRSSSPTIAEINAIGRITAKRAGSVTITATCGSASRSFTLEVVNVEVTTTVAARSIDLGDAPKEMAVGTAQMLAATVIPSDTTDPKLSYQSSNKSVATINELGRITALAVGETTITVACGNARNSFKLKVVAIALDLGDPPKEMAVGSSQLLNVSVIPADAANQKISYASSNGTAATINEQGRITARAVGETTITVSCGNANSSFKLKVVALALDLGEPQKEMAIGSSQMLNVSVIPYDAANQKISYASSSAAVAAVNGLGRISALAQGETTITVTCGDARKSFTLKVVPVAIEVEDFEDELAVDETLRLAARVTPENAPVTTIQYKSSDPKIATVNPSGEVKGIAPGNVTIMLTAGEAKKDILLIVNIAGKRVELNSKYIILKPGEQFQLQARLVPADARQTIKYKSFDSNVATVSSDGTIIAQGFGTTTVLASTDDTGAAATVIVNQSGTAETTQPGEVTIPANATPAFTTEISAAAYPILTSDMLKYYYESGKICTIIGDGYKITISGRDIANHNNEFQTALAFSSDENGTSFVLNEGKPLCGPVTVELTEPVPGAKYLYLYNDSSGKYKQLQAENLSMLRLDVAGKYLLASKKLNGFKLNAVFIIIGGVVLLGGVAAYIAVKKRHWFW
jgi:uncharacterized protein YjdB